MYIQIYCIFYSIDMDNNLIKYIYHCSYLANIFYITYSAMQTVSVFFFYYIRGVIYTMWKAVSKAFHCKFMLSSKSIYVIFYTSIIIVYINTW